MVHRPGDLHLAAADSENVTGARRGTKRPKTPKTPKAPKTRINTHKHAGYRHQRTTPYAPALSRRTSAPPHLHRRTYRRMSAPSHVCTAARLPAKRLARTPAHSGHPGPVISRRKDFARRSYPGVSPGFLFRRAPSIHVYLVHISASLRFARMQHPCHLLNLVVP